MNDAVFRAIAIGSISILAAHALSYALLAGLPDAAVVLLGLSAGQEAAAEVVRQQFLLPPYPKILLKLASGDLGTTLDGTVVSAELLGEAAQSLPRLFMAAAIALICGLTGAFFAPARGNAGAGPIVSFLTFIPPYLPAFVAFALLIMLGVGIQPSFGTWAWWGSVLAAALAPSALIAMQASSVMRNHLGRPYATFQYAAGATPLELRSILIHNVISELMPTLEKAVTWLLANLLFVELVLGLPGLGSMAARALRRSDPYLILGVVLAFALITNVMRVVSVIVRSHYGIKSS